MSNFLEKIVGDFEEKKEWKEMKARAKALPGDYRLAYGEIQKYIWKTSGIGTLRPLENLLDLLEEGAANGKSVLELTGSDVAAFADELVRGEDSYFEKSRKDLNSSLLRKLGKKDAGE